MSPDARHAVLGGLLLALAGAAPACAQEAEPTEEEQAAARDPILPAWFFPDRELKFYGQIAPAFVRLDDQFDVDSGFADNFNSPSRLGLFFNWSGFLGPSRVNLEVGLNVRGTGDFRQGATPEFFDPSSRSIRKAEYVNFAKFGTIYVGQGSMSTDGVAEQDQSGTTIVGGSNIADTAAAYNFRTSRGALSGVSVADVFANLDGFRSLRVRYDTPEWNGLYGSVSAGSEVLFENLENDTAEAAAFYKREAGGFLFAAAAGAAFVRDRDGPDDARVAASASVLERRSGLNLMFATGAASQGGTYLYGKFGWRFAGVFPGVTFLSADFYRGWDFGGSGNDSTSIGFGASQNIEALKGEIYAGYRLYHFEADGPIDYEPLSSLLLGVRWRF